jgi:hypothetical protein
MTEQAFLAALTGRAKDRADLIRICESHPQIIPQIPPGLVAEVDDLRQTG